MNENFETSLANLATLEGRETHTVDGDPGGTTSGFGIIQKTYTSFREFNKLPDRSVADIEEWETKKILRVGFWETAGCDDLEDGVDFAVFQHAVNTGFVGAVKSLQRALKPYYSGNIDGLIGPLTLHEAWCSNKDDLLEGFFDEQVGYYTRLKDVAELRLPALLAQKSKDPAVKKAIKKAIKKYKNAINSYQGWKNRVYRSADMIGFNYIPLT